MHFSLWLSFPDVKKKQWNKENILLRLVVIGKGLTGCSALSWVMVNLVDFILSFTFKVLTHFCLKRSYSSGLQVNYWYFWLLNYSTTSLKAPSWHSVFAGIASVHFRQPGRAWYAGDYFSCSSRYNIGENIWWSWPQDSVLRVSSNYSTGLLSGNWFCIQL